MGGQRRGESGGSSSGSGVGIGVWIAVGSTVCISAISGGSAGCAGSGDDSELRLLSPAESSPSGCPPGPPGIAEEAVEAIEAVNRIRRPAGLDCIEQVPEVVLAAERHCQYFVANGGHCVGRPHREASNCKNFTAEAFSERMHRAGYTGFPRFEVMAYVGDGQTSVQMWLDSVWHRIPILSPQVNQAGYGTAGRCDTIDFGARPGSSLVRTNVIYPRDGQIAVPLSFNGREFPEPPPPPGPGWPSGYPVTLIAAGLQVSNHHIAVAGTDQPLDHIFLAPGDPGTEALLVDEFLLYTFRPFTARTRYQVVIAGTQEGAPVRFEWTFTTR
jgi:hypothetical protein